MWYLKNVYEPPKLSGKIIERQANEKFNTGHEFIFICAPAGYGKTTLAADWAHSLSDSVAWFDLEDADYLPIKDLTEYHAVVFDNFNASRHEEPAKHFFKKFSGKIIVISRNQPPAWFNDFMIEHRACIIGEQDLKFSPEEIYKLFEIYARHIPKFCVDIILANTSGWPALVTAIMLFSDDCRFSEKAINLCCGKYFSSKLCEFRSDAEKEFLMKAALPDYFDECYCEAVSNGINYMSILKRLSVETGFLIQNSNVFCYQPVFRKFLLSELKNRRLKCKAWYNEASMLSVRTGHIQTAFNIAIESADKQILEDIFFAIHDLPHVDIGIANLDRLASRIKKHFYKEVFQSNPQLANKIKCLQFITSDLKSASAPQIREILNELGFALFLSSLTHDLPFIHKSRHDYSTILPCLEEYIKTPGLLSNFLWGVNYPLIEKLIICGLLYEKHDFTRAYMFLCELEASPDNTPYALLFCFRILKYELLLSLGKNMYALEELKNIEFASNTFLFMNLWAYKTKIALYNGDSESGRLWLEQFAPDYYQPLNQYLSFQNLTTARALIVSGKLYAAVELLDRLLTFADNHEHIINVLEILTLKAICIWPTDRNEAAVNLERAVLSAGKFGLTRPITAEGVDILPVLEYSLNRLRLGHCDKELNGKFLRRLYILSTETSQKGSGLLYNLPKKAVKLSKRQLTVLKLLSDGMSYEQIANEMGVKITTVRDHITKLYEKLGVNNSKEAILKGFELSLI